MKILKGILAESKGYYIDAKKKIEQKLSKFPKGNIKERIISKRKYYYLQIRKGGKIVHKYLGKEKPDELIKQIKQRNLFKKELKNINASIKLLKKIDKPKYD